MKNDSVKIFIVEDMAIPRAGLEAMLLKNGYEISGSTATAEAAWKDIKKANIDLILLDINLAGQKNGIWLAQQVRKHLNIPIVYLTAYGDQQTLKEVIDTQPNGYLMKPYQEPTLLTTIAIALSNFSKHQQKKGTIEIQKDSINYLFIKDRKMKIKIYFNDIYYVKSDGNYLEVVLKDKKYVIRKKLLAFKHELPNKLFFQCHQRYLINIHQIIILGKDFIQIDKQEIPISSKYQKELESIIANM